MEAYQRDRYLESGIDAIFVQDNQSRTLEGFLKGLHFTREAPQAQMIYVSSGNIFDVVVDLRQGSPTYGDWYGVHLNTDPIRQLFIPSGFAHGYCVTTEFAEVHYKVTHFHNPPDEGGINWRDPDLAIDWPVANPVSNARDAAYPFLSELSGEDLPRVCFDQSGQD